MDSLEQAWKEVCELHERMVHAPAPDIGPQAFLPFPPGVEPVSFAVAEVQRLKQMWRERGETTSFPDGSVTWVPRTNVFAGEEGVQILVELPGVARQDVEVSVSGGELSVRGMRRAPKLGGTWQPVAVEQVWGAFERRFPLPPWCALENIQARHADGMLAVTMTRVKDNGTSEFSVSID
jgi:HSP20 family protein